MSEVDKSGAHVSSTPKLTLCEACTDGDHGNCGLQSWCECQDERDGDRDAPPDHGPACPCNSCINAEIAENDDD